MAADETCNGQSKQSDFSSSFSIVIIVCSAINHDIDSKHLACVFRNKKYNQINQRFIDDEWFPEVHPNPRLINLFRKNSI